MKSIIFFLGTAFVLTLVQGHVININRNVQCDAVEFKTCVATFASQFGIKNLNKNVTLLALTMAELVKNQGLDGYKHICSAGKNLKQCVGPQYDSCMSKDFLISQGVSAADALGFESLSDQETYICTTGWDVLSKNYDCIQKVTEESQQYFGQCIATMIDNITKDPAHACKYTQEMSDCYAVPFKKACDPAVFQEMCHVIEMAFKPSYPQCTFTCPPKA